MRSRFALACRCAHAALCVQAVLAPLRAASAAGVAREQLLPLAPFAKYASDALAAGAKPWEGPPVLLSGAAADGADEPFWVRAPRFTLAALGRRLTVAHTGWFRVRKRANEQGARGFG